MKLDMDFHQNIFLRKEKRKKEISATKMKRQEV
jgi:hypothetical protein